MLGSSQQGGFKLADATGVYHSLNSGDGMLKKNPQYRFSMRRGNAKVSEEVDLSYYQVILERNPFENSRKGDA
jgi:hypothetical protein